MSRLEEAAIEVHKVFWNNIGVSDEWPIQMLVDEDLMNKVSASLNELRNAAEEVIPGIGDWPVKQLVE